MLWEVEVRPLNHDAERERISAEMRELGLDGPAPSASARVFLLNGALTPDHANRIARELLTDSTVEAYRLNPQGTASASETLLNVLPKPGVMDPVADSVQHAIRDLGLPEAQVRTGRRYLFPKNAPAQTLEAMAWKVLANDAIEQVTIGPLPAIAYGMGGAGYVFRLVIVPLRQMNDDQLMKLSKEGQLHLSMPEMQTIRRHFEELGRDPTDVELETLAQTWSEHCSHKTLKGKIDYSGPDGQRSYANLLKQTIFHATEEIRQRLDTNDWCVSVFADNAGVVRFDDKNHVCFKVETHNHPSAIEPYGGANTGLGGVIRDVLGTGLGGEPICNTDVFCFAPPDYSTARLPAGVLHPKRVMRGVVAGVRDYGNRMGIPTVNGAICFDERFLANPLVYCGTVGLIPVGMEHKEAKPGDLIVAVGGRTGRDGIHGATFSSAELTHESESLSGGAVQIGNAITEKKVLDVLLQARDRRLYHSITDCGAGGFSSAVGEMGAELGAEVHLDRAPLKYEGLSYVEIWISEAQERMVLAVPPERWHELHDLCASEDVEATVLGEFKATGRLRLIYQGQQVADLDMQFLHEGRPPVVREATLSNPPAATPAMPKPVGAPANRKADLLGILASLNICSKEWVIRQYDHEVRGGTLIKPLVGVRNDGPSDAAVVSPVFGSARGLALGCGINPRYGDLDPYWMAASVIDEAVRNVVAVGADPNRVALLDNFCWGNTERPEVLGSLVRAAEACRDVALAFGTPFISGKDSLNNEYRAGALRVSIPPTLLISALGIVPNVRQCVTMDLKAAGDVLYLLGETKDDFGGSEWYRLRGRTDGMPPRVDLQLAPRIFAALHHAIANGWVAACHDLSEGGLAVGLAEMCFAGELGATVTLPHGSDVERELFAESNTRFIVEIRPEHRAAFERAWQGLPQRQLGVVATDGMLMVQDAAQREILKAATSELRDAWQRPLRW